MQTLPILGFILLPAVLAAGVPAQSQPREPSLHVAAAPRSLLERPALLLIEDAPLASALAELQLRSGVPLAFSPSLLPGARVTCACRTITVGQALDRMLAGTSFRYAELSSQILVEPVRLEPAQLTVPTFAGLETMAPPADANSESSASFTARVGERISRLFDRRAAQITGVVHDADSGQPLRDVIVNVVGTRHSGVSDENGRFLILNVEPGIYRLEARRIGFADARQENVRVPADGVVSVEFRLRIAALTLDAVVVTGVAEATSARRVPFTVARVGAEELSVPAENAVNSIQGKVAGASVVSSPQPGGGANIVLRSPTSINKSSSPLIVVDGVILASTFSRSTADLDALDIESIEVVKGAAAASLYGSRAANGVIQIRTARGSGLSEGQTRIQVRTEFGQNQLARGIGLSSHHHYLMNAAGEYVDAAGNVVPREQRTPRPAGERFSDVPYGVRASNHVDDFFDPGSFRIASVNIAQNAGSTNFFASFASHHTDGVVLAHGGYGKNDVRVNFDHQLRNDLRLSFSGFHMRSTRDNIPGNTFFNLIQQAPDISLLTPDPDGTPYAHQPDSLGVTPNPLYELAVQTNEEKRSRTLGSADLRFTPIQWFSVDGNVSYDLSDRQSYFHFPRGRKTTTAAYAGGYSARSSGTTTALNGSVSANVVGSIGDLTTRFTVRGLMERESYALFNADVASLSVEGVPSLDSGTVPTVGETTSDIRSEGYFFTTDLDYAGRYIANALVRRDGSSLFGPAERWHTYYRASVAYRMAEEPWWPFAWMNEFKLRYSLGTAGGRPSYADQYETYSFNPGGTVLKGTLGNRFLKPERAREQEIGLDAIIADRFSVQLNYARQRTVDQLVLIPLPAGFGFSSQWQNAGTVEGNTYEATLEALLLNSRDTRLSVNLVADRTRNEITEFNRACFRTGTASVTFRCAGEPLGVFYGHRFAARPGDLPADVPASEFQVNDDGLLVWVGQNGDWRNHQWGTSTTLGGRTYGWGLPFLLQDSTGSNAVLRIGDSNPDFRVGLGGNLRWRGLAVYGLLDVQVGGHVYNRTNQRMYQYFRSGDTDQSGRPQDRKKTTDYYTALYGANLINDWFVEDAGYTKLRELSVRYALPASGLGPLRTVGFDRVTLGLVGRNLFTSAKYRGYDPEVGTPLLRMDDFVYPQYRTITASVEIQF